MVQVALESPIAAPRAVQIGTEYLAWKSTALAPVIDNKRRRRIVGQKGQLYMVNIEANKKERKLELVGIAIKVGNTTKKNNKGGQFFSHSVFPNDIQAHKNKQSRA